MKKKVLRAFACALAIVSFAAFPACGLLDSTLSQSSYEESEDGSNNGTATENSSEESDESSEDPNSSSDETSDETSATPDPDPTPDPDKTVARYETDRIGHKIAYYTDGTSEDLGRVTPLDFASPEPQFQYGYKSLANESKGEGMCGFYEDLYDTATAFHQSTRTLTVETDGEGSYALLAEMDYDKYGLTDEEAIAVWKVFGDENFVFYWLDISFTYGNGSLGLYVDPAYVSYSVRQTADAAIEQMALECDGYLSGSMTDTELALHIYDYILATIDYAYEADGETPVEESWAYNIAGGAMNGYGVCECYAETYAYFCGMLGIECLNVVGYAGEEGNETQWGGHAWNYLCLDGGWYAVDITWADYETFDRWYFGIPLDDYNATHRLDLPKADWGVEYQCAMPTLSGELAPVLFCKEGEEKIMVKSLDEALEKMTDEGGRYEVTLYPDSAVSAKSDLPITNYGEVTLKTVFPKVAHIHFIGNEEYDPYYGESYIAQIISEGEISLQCDITLTKAEFLTTKDGKTYIEPWKKNGYTVLQK